MNLNTIILFFIRKHPLLFCINLLLIIFSSLLVMGTALTIAPLMAIVMNTSSADNNSITNFIIAFINFIGLSYNLYTVGFLFVIMQIVTAFLKLLIGRFLLITKYCVIKDIVVEAFDSFFNSRWYFFSSINQGVLLNTFIGEASKIGNAFDNVAKFFASILQISIILILPFYLSWQITLICIILGIIFNLPTFLLTKYLVKYGRRNTETANFFSSVIQESLSAAKIILGFAKQKDHQKLIHDAYNNHTKATLKSQTLDIAIAQTSLPITMLIVIIALLISEKINTPINILAIVMYSLYSLLPIIGTLIGFKANIHVLLPSFEQLQSLQKKAENLKQVSGDRRFIKISNQISIEKLNFEYNKNYPILKNIDLKIKKGKMTAIVGESGSGKSTLIDVLLGLNVPLSGTIKVDNFKLEEYMINTYRNKIGYVPQDSMLFDLSIEDNIRWAKNDASFEDIEKACTDANANEFIQEFPKKHKTIVGNRGVRLSGGQAQRICLARAIIRKPELLILDEATSSLDTKSEKMIQQAIEKISQKTTTVVIAHRLSTVQNADYIYVLNKGTVVEEGNYNYLIDRNGVFAEMVNAQGFS